MDEDKIKSHLNVSLLSGLKVQKKKKNVAGLLIHGNKICWQVFFCSGIQITTLFHRCYSILPFQSYCAFNYIHEHFISNCCREKSIYTFRQSGTVTYVIYISSKLNIIAGTLSFKIIIILQTLVCRTDHFCCIKNFFLFSTFYLTNYYHIKSCL